MQKRTSQAVHGKGLVGHDRHAWVTVAEQAVFELVDTGLAVPHVEIEARLFDTGWNQPGGGPPITFFPHILDEARNNLLSGGNITMVRHTTKGAATAELYVPAEQRRRTTAIERATMRKAMLYARFIRVSETFGDAGETVLRRSLVAAMPHGYQPMTLEPNFGEVRRIGDLVMPGPLDSGAWVTVKDARGLPQQQHALVMEMKNRRLTLYPRHKEVHQLLDKAARLQQQHPDLPIVPLLVCRNAHSRLFWMAKDLGFLVHGSRRHFLTLPKGITAEQVEGLRAELGLADLTVDSRDSPNHIVGLFSTTMPKTAADTAKRWAAVGSQLGGYYTPLRNEKISEQERSEYLQALRTDAAPLLQAADVENPILAWALEEEPDYEDIDYERD